MNQSVKGLLTAVGVGAVLGIVKLVYSFFPLFNVTDVIVFVLAGWAFVRISESRSLANAFIICFPAMAFSLYFVSGLGFERLTSGIGTGWLLSVFIIPIACLAGAWLGRKTAA